MDSPAAAKSASAIRVMLVDDHVGLRHALALLVGLEPDILVVAEASGGAEAIELCRAHLPQIVLMDVKMPGMDGIEATRRILDEMPDTCVIGFSMFAAEEMSARMHQAGARGYLQKDCSTEALVEAIRSAAHSGK
jgi:DNA-binding NarL/FixJ family response regulator